MPLALWPNNEARYTIPIKEKASNSDEKRHRVTHDRICREVTRGVKLYISVTRPNLKALPFAFSFAHLYTQGTGPSKLLFTSSSE